MLRPIMLRVVGQQCCVRLRGTLDEHSPSNNAFVPKTKHDYHGLVQLKSLVLSNTDRF